MTRAFDQLMAPFGGHTGAALAAVALLFGVAAILLFRVTSDQGAIRTLRAAQAAHVLEMRIYQDDLVLMLRALGKALAANLRYLGLVLVSVLAVGALFAALLPQLDARFARAPLSAGGATMITVTCRPGFDVMGPGLALEPGGGAVTESRVRVPARREVSWGVRLERAGAPTATLVAGAATWSFALAAAPGTGVVGASRSRSPLDPLLHPGLPRLRDDAPIERIEVRYPAARHRLLGRDVHWLVAFAFWSLVGALVPKLVFRIAV